MMKIFKFIVISLVYSYNLLPKSVIEKKPFYILKNMTAMHEQCVINAINTFNNICNKHDINLHIHLRGYLTQQEIINNPQYNVITYMKENDQLSYTNLNGYTMSNDTKLHINNINIYISLIHITNIIACYNIMLHEIGHAFGLMHNNINGSIMNSTVTVDEKLNTVSVLNGNKPIKHLNYHIDDLYGMWLYSTRKI